MDFTTLTQYDLWLLPLLSGPHTMFLDMFSQVLTHGLTWMALYLTLFLIVIKNNETMAQIGLVIGAAALCILLADGMADGIAKPLFMRLRPLNDPEVRQYLALVAGVSERNFSFFSAHAANTFSICVFFSLLVRNVWFTSAMVIWSLTNCWTRMYLGLHYPSDIAVGLLWGGIVGMGVYILYRKLYYKVSPRLHFISSQYTRTGYALADIYLVMNVMLLTVLYAIFRALLCM